MIFLNFYKKGNQCFYLPFELLCYLVHCVRSVAGFPPPPPCHFSRIGLKRTDIFCVSIPCPVSKTAPFFGWVGGLLYLPPPAIKKLEQQQQRGKVDSPPLPPLLCSLISLSLSPSLLLSRRRRRKRASFLGSPFCATQRWRRLFPTPCELCDTVWDSKKIRFGKNTRQLHQTHYYISEASMVL